MDPTKLKSGAKPKQTKVTSEERREAFGAIVELASGLPVFGMARIAMKRVMRYASKKYRARIEALETELSLASEMNLELAAALDDSMGRIHALDGEVKLLKHEVAELTDRVGLLKEQRAATRKSLLRPSNETGKTYGRGVLNDYNSILAKNSDRATPSDS